MEEIQFNHTLPIQLRFNDVDKFGHVNNTVYFSFYDLGKTEYFASVCPDVDWEKDGIVVVGLRRIEIVRQEVLYPVYDAFQYQCGERRKNTHKKTENQYELLLLDILFAPNDEALQQTPLILCHFFLLFANNLDDSALAQLNDAGRFRASRFLLAVSYYIIYRRLDVFTYFTEVAGRRLPADIGRSRDYRLTELLAKPL